MVEKIVYAFLYATNPYHYKVGHPMGYRTSLGSSQDSTTCRYDESPRALANHAKGAAREVGLKKSCCSMP